MSYKSPAVLGFFRTVVTSINLNNLNVVKNYVVSLRMFKFPNDNIPWGDKYDSDEKSFNFKLQGSRSSSNIFWTTMISLFGAGFFFLGLSSYTNSYFFLSGIKSDLTFLPQGIVLLFYGTLFTVIGLYLWITIECNVGFGYSQYTFSDIILYRKGFPGKNCISHIVIPNEEIDSLVLALTTRDNNHTSQRRVYLKLKDSGEICITGSKIPKRRADLDIELWLFSQYLQIPVQIIYTESSISLVVSIS
jgi:hypothetical protein